MIDSRIALCCPKDKSLNDAVFDGNGVCLAPGGVWLLDAVKVRLSEIGVTVTFADPDPGQYWWLELNLDNVAFRFTLSHTFPFACVAHLHTRLGVVDRLLRRDHAETSEALFKSICNAIEADPRAGAMLTWRGRSAAKDTFIRDASRTLGAPSRGVVRVDLDLGEAQGGR